MTTMSFWKTKKLIDMSVQEWESLCDGCGKCCLNKLEDEDTGEVYLTNAVCDLIDLKTCRCTRYQERTRLVPDCVDLKQSTAWTAFDWMPETCAYRLLAIGEDLPDWHPLVSGNSDSVKEAGVSISSFAIKESEVDDLEDHVIDWQ
ncbi:YcgN family cysteine cluster protein [Methylotuvimicrobium buryatense]|uniref:UPF0260 protein EQU24_09630 n=1 Tax=Methylotuvimicrobium buryatense TaxID=95641 RepID=A0A4P9UWB9_METBY|nr:YcgN family cysteine cluster protein [Methylotuvimicrobium buryatense]